MKKTVARKLLQSMDLQYRVLCEIKEVFLAEQKAMINFDMEKINKLNQRKFMLMEREQIVRDLRSKISRKTTSELLGIEKELSLDSLKTLINDKELDESLDKVLKKLSCITEEMEKIVEQNKNLVDYALKTIDGAARNLRKYFSFEHYNKNGSERRISKPGTIISGSV
ncbi:MAG: flagellar export chaperone FlgN [bacterium]